MRHARLIVVGLVCIGSMAAVSGAGPEGDTKEYRLGPKDGPYMIYIASFRGDNEQAPSRTEAQKLTQELRSRYKLESYMFSRSEREKAIRDKQLKEMHDRLGEDQYVKKIRVVEEWAVLIGHWPDRESATKYLYSHIKEKVDSKTGKTKAKLPPPQSVHGPSMFVLRSPEEMKAKGRAAEAAFEKEEVNLFERAWVVRNPLLVDEAGPPVSPTDAAVAAKLEAYNLAKCPKQYSLVVMGFRYSGRDDDPRPPDLIGSSAPGMLEHLWPFGSKSDNDQHRHVGGKSEAISAAVQLADGLRARYPGYDVYVWPMRQSIVVTVGALNFPKAQGDEDMKLLADAYNKLKGKKVGDITLFENPYPMIVPRS